MSAHRYPPEAKAIVGLLRSAAKKGRGVLTMSDVETLEQVLRTQARMVKVLHLCIAWIPHATVRSWPPGHRMRAEVLKAAKDVLAEAEGGK